jgi:hypothetical protein
MAGTSKQNERFVQPVRIGVTPVLEFERYRKIVAKADHAERNLADRN